MSFSTPDSDSNRRVFWADATRAVAIILVLLIHIFDRLYKADHRANISWWTVNVILSVAHTCIPIFFMLSGTFLLSKNESTATFYRKRLKKLVIPLVAWSVIYIFWDKRSFSFFFHDSHIYQLISVPLQRPAYYHLWFMYAIIGLYVLIPFVKKIALNSSEEELRAFMFLWFVASSVIPIYWKYRWLTGMGIEMLTGYAGYLVVGYVIGRSELSKKMGPALTAVFLINLGITAFGTYKLSNADAALNQTFLSPLQPNMILMSVSLFALFKFVAGTRSPNRLLSLVVGRLCKTCYGIYLVHPLLFDGLTKGTFGINLNSISIPPLLLTPLTFLIVLFFSYLVVATLQEIPIIKEIVP